MGDYFEYNRGIFSRSEGKGEARVQHRSFRVNRFLDASFQRIDGSRGSKNNERAEWMDDYFEYNRGIFSRSGGGHA